MAYNKDWYKAYESYLKEKTVRDAHDFVFSIFQKENNIYKQDVIDLGCGQSNEYRNYVKPLNYIGIDENFPDGYHDGFFCMGNGDVLIKGNYRNRKFLKEILNENSNKTNTFVSLFSSEVHGSYKENYDLYNWIFKTFPNIQAGLVSGLYHSHKKKKNPMIANGNKIYQALENIEDCNRKDYTERRIVMSVPSKLFGNHEVEVWKIFRRT